MSDSTFQTTADTAMTTLQKFFVAAQTGNVGVSVMALIDLAPIFAPAITSIVAIWVGVLTVRAKAKENKRLDLEIERIQRDLMVDEAQG